VIIQPNYAATALPKGIDIAELTSRVIAPLTGLVEDSGLDPEVVASLRVHLDWIQYKTNFRDPVILRRAVDHDERPLPLAEIAVDLRQADVEQLPAQLAAAVRTLASPPGDSDTEHRVYLGGFEPWRSSVIWPFNRLFWQRLAAWEAAANRGFEAALPSGGSDANHPDAVGDSVADVWTLLRDMDTRRQLPAEIYAMEIGVGSGARARLWLDRFKALDDECGTGYYPRLRFLLGDYSPATLETALATVGPHAPLVSALAIDAHDPFKALKFLRFKILYIHLTNVYDNLIFDEIARRDGQLFIVEVRPFVSREAERRMASEFDLPPGGLTEAIRRLVEIGPEAFGSLDRGMAFWNCVWGALRLDERLRGLDEGDEGHVPRGVSREALDDVLADAPQDVRFHLSRGAAESFVHTVPLLHPRGFLQVQDVFVNSMKEYARGFRGPGKLDGSFVTWVNGAFLRAVGMRAGYDVHFAPFKYRRGSKTQILYTTPRD
jgi:hypothetical protein